MPATVGNVERHQGGRAANRLDAIVDLLEAAHRAGDQHAVRAFGSVGEGGGRTEAARGAGDQRDASGEAADGGFGH